MSLKRIRMDRGQDHTTDVYGRTLHPKEERKLDGPRAVTPASPRERKERMKEERIQQWAASLTVRAKLS